MRFLDFSQAHQSAIGSLCALLTLLTVRALVQLTSCAAEG